MKKTLKSLLLTVFASFAILPSVTSCNKNKIPDDPETLEIYTFKAGFGTAWVDAIKDAFLQEDWVKEKYPNARIYTDSNGLANYGRDHLTAGASANSIDLFFNQLDYDLAGQFDNKGNRYLENLDDLYNATVPGENVTYKEKMIDSFEVPYEEDGESHFYTTPYNGGYNGIIYNKTKFATLGIEVPLTTDQFIAACDLSKSLKGNNQGKYNLGYSIMSCTKVSYWRYMFTNWWAQYEGFDEYCNFYKGIYDETISNQVFTQEGRLESLRVLEKLLKKGNEYVYPSASAIEYMDSQVNFLTGMGLFHCNGDWFSNETKKDWDELKAFGRSNDEFAYMKTPVISAIINNLDDASIEDDNELQKVIKGIDDGMTWAEYESANPSEVSEADYNKVLEARYTIDTIGNNHTTFIPYYSNAKELAKDFLLFMATDKALKIYCEKTNGGVLPFNFNYKEDAQDVYNNLDTISQSKIDIYTRKFENKFLPSPNSYRLVYLGGLANLTMSGNLETRFWTDTSANVAETLYNNDIATWNNEYWNNMLRNAGM